MRKSKVGKMSRLNQSSDLRSSDFELSLVLPKTTFRPGDKIPFEVRIQNPHGVLLEFLTVSMVQTTVIFVTKKRRPFGAITSKALKMDTSKVTSENSGAGYHDTSWFGYLNIPLLLPPTILPWDPPTHDVVENRYFLQVVATQCENYPLLSREYPIQIEYSTPVRNTAAVPSRSPSIRRATSLLTPCQSPNLGLLGPPRYSSLSLDMLSPRSDRVSRSYETLPPNYGDLLSTSSASGTCLLR